MAHDILAGAPVVAGTDGSEPALAAVRLAAYEARLRKRPLVIIHAIPWPDVDIPLRTDLSGPVEHELRSRGETIVATATDAARAVAPDTDIHTDIRVSASASALIDASRQAALVAVGERGHSGVAGLLLGSTAQRVASRAHCPVLIARGTSAPFGPIVVGVDGAPESAAAIGYAFDEAELRGTSLTAVHAWLHPAVRAPGDMLPLVYSVEETEQEEARLLAEAVSGWRDKHPGVAVTTRLVRGHTRRVLIDAATGAQLLIVSARGTAGSPSCRSARSATPCSATHRAPSLSCDPAATPLDGVRGRQRRIRRAVPRLCVPDTAVLTWSQEAIMKSIKQWRVDVILGEDDGQTYAEARLITEIGDRLVGVGRAHLAPTDFDVPEIGDEVAVARALSDLGARLLVTAAGDIGQVTDEHVRLTR